MQVQSNALAALEAIDPDMAAEIMAEGCVTGDRINGLCDGLSGEWYCKFDTYHPAVDNGLPVTRVISRITLQQILVKYAMRIAGKEIIQPETKVVAFEEDKVEGHERVCLCTLPCPLLPMHAKLLPPASMGLAAVLVAQF
jgi:zeaxanthin epoxidase